MDVVSVSQAGIPGAVATLGTALTNEQARLLKRYAPQVYLAYDGDEAGQHAIERGLDILESEDVPCRVLYFPDGQDPDEFIRAKGAEAFEALRPMQPTAFRMQRLRMQYSLDTQEGKTEYAKACAALLKKVKDPVDLENYLDLLSVQTGFSREVLLAQIGVSAPAKPEAQPNNPPIPRDKLPANRSRLPEGYKTEQTLLALLAAGKLPRDMVKEEDFASEALRPIAVRLLAGDTPSAIISDPDLSDEGRQAAGEAFNLLTETLQDNAAAVAEDCMRHLHIQHLQQELTKMNGLVSSAEATPEQKEQALEEARALSKELAQLKQQGR